MSENKTKPARNHLFRALMPLSAALLLVVCVSGVFIYPFLFSVAGVGTGVVSELAGKLLITALVSLCGALIPAMIMSFNRDKFSISITLVLSLTVAVAFSWLSMLIQRISPLGGIGGFSGGVLNVMFTALIGTVPSVAPALLATLACVLRRIISGLMAKKKRAPTAEAGGAAK